MNNKNLILGIIGVLILVLIIGVVLSKDSAPPTNPAQVSTEPGQDQTIIEVNSSGFSPEAITIKSGTKVVWQNKSGDIVQINSDPHPIHNLYSILNIGQVTDGNSASVVFTKAGTYTYHDHLDSSRKGTIIVE